jgi:curved DNA-binding protein CbpA
MSMGFYELLGVQAEADAAGIRAAYQEQVAQTMRRLRAAEARQQDTATLEARRASLAEASAVLSDPIRRHRYDRFLELARTGFPADLEELWRQAGPSLVDPAAGAALDVVRTLTALRVGDSFGLVEVVEEPEPEPTAPTANAPSASEPAPSAPLATPRIAAALAMDRTVSTAEVARLLDVYGPTGAWLRAAREARKLDLDAVSASTKVARRFLESMEQEAWASLPAATFVRGYLRVLIRTLELCVDAEEAEEAVQGYMARFHRDRE